VRTTMPAPVATRPAPATDVNVSQSPGENIAQLDAGTFWPECLRLSSTSRRLRMIVEETTLVSLTSGTATIAVGSKFAGLARGSAAELAELFSRAAGTPVKVVFDELASTTESSPAFRGNSATAALSGASALPLAEIPSASAGADVRQHPLVKHAEELFGARVVRVDPACQ
jgi:hypothetical protein